jgi:hypothetical protein
VRHGKGEDVRKAWENGRSRGQHSKVRSEEEVVAVGKGRTKKSTGALLVQFPSIITFANLFLSVIWQLREPNRCQSIVYVDCNHSSGSCVDFNGASVFFQDTSNHL